MKLRICLSLILIFVVISLILSIASLFLPWYYIRVDIDEIDGNEVDGLRDLEDRLGEREDYIEIEYEGDVLKETENLENNKLKRQYPDTANCKNITLALIWILIILLSIAIFIKKYPGDEQISQAYYLYGKCFFNQEDYSRALEIFKEIAEKCTVFVESPREQVQKKGTVTQGANKKQKRRS